MISICAPHRHRLIAQRFEHLGLGGLRGAHQQRLGGHDHAVEAVAALRGLFADEGVLHRIGMIARAEAFERQNVALDAAADRDHAGARGDAVDQHGAGAALAEPAAVFRSVQFKIVAQHVKQRGVGRGVDVMDPAIDCQADRGLRHAAGSGSDGCVANIASKPLRRYRLHTNVQAWRSRGETACPVYEQTRQATEFLFGSGVFRFRRRLTGFRSARNIVRIRTKCPDRGRELSTPP